MMESGARGRIEALFSQTPESCHKHRPFFALRLTQ